MDQPTLIKIYWPDIRKKIADLDANFAQIVDELSPDKTFPLYLAYYPYGSFIADTQSSYIPTIKGIQRLTDSSIDKDIIKNLGYGKDSLPMGMVLEKQIEYFIDLKDSGITIPWLIYEPGSFFPFTTILGQRSIRNYAPNSVLMTTAGARSAFMLSNIGCVTNHVNLQRDFNIQQTVPKTLNDHWHVFREIVNSKVVKSDWRCCVVYFAEKWLQKLYTDKSWLPLKSYLLELAWHRFEYDRNKVYYDIAFSYIQKKRNLKPNPYLTDTAKHLFAITLGSAPGFAPAINENALPVSLLQKAFIESYELKKYLPIIMQPVNYNFEEKENCVYYSLQNPSTYSFSPKSRKISSTLFEMRELEHIMRVFSEEFSKENGICSDTVLNELVKNVNFQYFHNEIDRHKIIKHSSEIEVFDPKFKTLSLDYKLKDSVFSEDAKFLRGCISISTKEKDYKTSSLE